MEEFKVGDIIRGRDGLFLPSEDVKITKVSYKNGEPYYHYTYSDGVKNGCSHKYVELVKSANTQITKSQYKEAKWIIKVYNKENKLKVGDQVKLKRTAMSGYLNHEETYTIKEVKRKSFILEDWSGFEFVKKRFKKA
jgi:hypothetical protein